MTGPPASTFGRRLRGELARGIRWRFAAPSLLLVAALLFFWRPLQRQWLTYVVLRSPVPRQTVLFSLVKQSGNPQSLLSRLWQTQRLSDRQFVLRYLGDSINGDVKLFGALEPIVVDGTADADNTTREFAFRALAIARDPRLHPLALARLADADPAARVLGLQYLRRVATSNDVPIAVRLLDDPDPRVVVAAALVLRQATGLDFGINTSALALPEFTSWDQTNPPPPDIEAIALGVQRWHAWWRAHRAEYPGASQPPPATPQPTPLPTSDFALPDATTGRTVRLSDYRGKVVLLWFWSLDAPICLADAPALNALQRRNSQRLAVLGICVLPATDEDMPDMPGMRMPAPPTAAQARVRIRRLARKNNMTYPLLYDSEGSLGLRFDVEALPTYVLLDTQGRICRRFAGSRNRAVLEAMVENAARR